MKKTESTNSRLVSDLLCRAALVIFALFFINELVYASVVPVIFFHGIFSEKDYQANQNDSRLQELVLNQSGDTIYGWQHGDVSDRVVLYFGGDSADSSSWIRSAVLGHLDTWEECTVLTFDYPTFGKSSGYISERLFYETAETVYHYACTAFPDARIYAMGYSIGSAAALYLSHIYPVDGLILVAPMYDGTSLYLPKGSFLYSFFEPLSTVQMQNDWFASKCAVKALVIASERDQMTKFKDIESLCAYFPTKPALISVPDCEHGDYWTETRVYRAIQDYLGT